MTTPTLRKDSIESGFDALRQSVSGDLILPGDERYDEARLAHAYGLEGRPAAIVRPLSSREVAQAVRFARANAYPIAVRSGGHSLAGYASPDGALVIDLSDMKAVVIDPATRIARVQGGATSADLAIPANAHGLALSTGDTSSVGLGGLTTGGGIGYFVRKHGLAIDNLLGAEVVTADGSVLWANATEHASLFWAIRGGGGNFGIVTEFEFQLAPVDTVLGGAIVLPATREVIRGYLDLVVGMPDDLTTITNVMLAPPLPFIPEDRVGEPVLVILTVWTGDEAEGQRVLEPLRALAEPIADTMGIIPYPEIYQYMEIAAQRHGGAVRATFANAVDDEAIDAIVEAMHAPAGPFTMVQLRGLGGAMARVPADATAFAHRGVQYLVTVLGLWLDPDEDPAPHRAWAEALWQRIQHIRAGVYVNFLEKEGEARIRDAYPTTTYERLAAVKQRYDPENVFSANQNVRPAR